LGKRELTLFSIITASVLLGGAFLGSIPFASADNHDDDDTSEELKMLKEEVEEILEDLRNSHKCTFGKYGKLCDFKKPEINITFPEENDEIPQEPFVITGTAFDDISGIKEVKVKILNTKEFSQFKLATLTGDGNWEFPVDELEPGVHVIIAKAKDFAGNSMEVGLLFKVEGQTVRNF